MPNDFWIPLRFHKQPAFRKRNERLIGPVHYLQVRSDKGINPRLSTPAICSPDFDSTIQMGPDIFDLLVGEDGTLADLAVSAATPWQDYEIVLTADENDRIELREAGLWPDEIRLPRTFLGKHFDMSPYEKLASADPGALPELIQLRPLTTTIPRHRSTRRPLDW